MPHINKSWREQRKAVTSRYVWSGETEEWISIWQASHAVAAETHCSPDTAKKEIKKAIASGKPRYDRYWNFKE